MIHLACDIFCTEYILVLRYAIHFCAWYISYVIHFGTWHILFVIHFCTDTSCMWYIFARDHNTFSCFIFCVFRIGVGNNFKDFLKIADCRKPIQTHFTFDALTSCENKWVNSKTQETHGKFHDTPRESSGFSLFLYFFT